MQRNISLSLTRRPRAVGDFGTDFPIIATSYYLRNYRSLGDNHERADVKRISMSCRATYPVHYILYCLMLIPFFVKPYPSYYPRDHFIFLINIKREH